VDEYEGGHRVPFFLRFPTKSGITAKAFGELTTYTDFMPTLLDYVGSSAADAEQYDGTSLMPLITSGSQPTLMDRFRVVDTQRKLVPVKGKQSCVMQGNWRLLNGKDLYDLTTDPGQRVNVAAQHPERVAAMQAAYESWWGSMAEDLKVVHRIVVGHEAEPTTLLTAHDWQTTNPPPWNQNFIRSGRVDNGSWALDVAQAGNYRIRLYRYPPEAKLAFNAIAPKGEDIPNGTPYAPGVSISPTKVRCTIGDAGLEAAAPAAADEYVEFATELAAGPTELFTAITDQDGSERGAYYVTLTRIE
ncbi:MAG: N-acetylgalactosamine-4-sulfatase, partial [Bacteroidota bacterium]